MKSLVSSLKRNRKVKNLPEKESRFSVKLSGRYSYVMVLTLIERKMVVVL